MSTKLVAGALAAAILLFSANAIAQRFGDDDRYDEPDMASCDNEIEEYQTAVKICLDNATTLSDAKACSEAEP